MSGDGARATSGELRVRADADARPAAPCGRRLLSVTANEPLGAYRVVHLADPAGPVPAAGQFAMLMTGERWGAGDEERPFLPRAFSYARFRDGEAWFLIEDVGPGSARLCELRVGEGVWLLGPLGRGFGAPREARRPVLVGGGVGIAPLAILKDELQARGIAGGEETTVLLGFRDRARAQGAALLDGCRVASDDGSVGHRGSVVELLECELAEDARASVYACGPPAMLEAVRSLCELRRVPVQLALEAGMACGFGACFGCVVPTRWGYVRLCVDGPVLDGEQLDWVWQLGGDGDRGDGGAS